MFIASRRFHAPFVKLCDMCALEIIAFCSYKHRFIYSCYLFNNGKKFNEIQQVFPLSERAYQLRQLRPLPLQFECKAKFSVPNTDDISLSTVCFGVALKIISTFWSNNFSATNVLLCAIVRKIVLSVYKKTVRV